MADTRPADLIAGRPALVVGGGRMGLAIAQILSAAGIAVTVVEPHAGTRETARERLLQIFRVREQPVEGAELVRVVADLGEAPADTAFVIEAAPENVELKQSIFRRLEQVCPADAIFATNTSVIPVNRIAAEVQNKARVVGTHFWNPPYMVRLVEVVKAEGTSEETMDRTIAVLAAVGQQPVRVNKDIPGFIGNRLQHALKREAIALVQAGVCDAETVDTVVKASFGSRLGIMGPLEQSDLVGLNLTLAIHEVILPDLDNSAAPQKLLVDLVAAGHTGANVGQGFRNWTAEERTELQTRLDRVLGAKKNTKP
ncbi:MAG: FAD-dependent monooxygenase [Alphaproteobacteria bacterium]|nr:FAD-dependent monooxygenase [Alphaproteobacteria bacterium]